jgi:exosome complex component RRP4
MASFVVERVRPQGASAAASTSSLAPLASYMHLSGHADPAPELDDDAPWLDPEAADEAAAQGGARLASAGEVIASSAAFMRGHGAFLSAALAASAGAEAPAIVASLCGTVSRVNRLISVAPVRTRYAPEVGDLVVGRIADVSAGQRRWRVELGARQLAALALASVNLPGGVQRRKLEADELQMRQFFQEQDLLVAEVQSSFADGSVALHTRSLRYGKLRNGALALVQPVLVQRLKSHFVTLPQADVDLTIGLNGYVWVSKHQKFDVDKAEGEAKRIESGLAGKGTGRDVDGVYSDVNEVSKLHVRTDAAGSAGPEDGLVKAVHGDTSCSWSSEPLVTTLVRLFCPTAC